MTKYPSFSFSATSSLICEYQTILLFIMRIVCNHFKYITLSITFIKQLVFFYITDTVFLHNREIFLMHL